MKANITYSVEAERIPEEVVRITEVELDRIRREIDNTSEAMSDALEADNVLELRRRLEEFGRSIARINDRFLEASHILAGYINYLNNGSEEEEAGGSEDDDLLPDEVSASENE